MFNCESTDSATSRKGRRGLGGGAGGDGARVCIGWWHASRVAPGYRLWAWRAEADARAQYESTLGRVQSVSYRLELTGPKLHATQTGTSSGTTPAGTDISIWLGRGVQ